MVLELTWTGGGEILRIPGDDIEALLDEAWIDETEVRTRLDDEVVQTINDTAQAYKCE